MRLEIKKSVVLLAVLAMLAQIVVSCAKSANKAGSADNSAVLATVGNKKITTAMYEEELNALPPQVKQYFMRAGGNQAFLNEIINKEILYQEAKREGIDKNARLKKAVRDYKKIAMVKILLAQKIGSPTVTDADVKNYYDSHKEAFTVKGPGKKEKTIPFATIQALIRQHLMESRQEKAFTTYVNSLKTTAKININEQAVQALAPQQAAPQVGNAPAAK